MTAPIHLLVNPAAGGGRAARRIERAYAALRTVGPVHLIESERTRDETRIAVDAARAHARALVVLGGDGSVSHAARGLIAERSSVPLAVLAAGTGNDFAKSIGLPSHDFLAMAQCIGAGHTRTIDAAEIDGVPFVNAAGFGFDVDVLSRVRSPQSRMWLRGTALYVVTALSQLFRYRGFEASLPHIAGDTPTSWLTVVFANGKWFGGAFQIAPHAQLSDGMIACVAVGQATPLQRIIVFARALRGTHMSMPLVRTALGKHFEMQFDTRPHFQADGELHLARERTLRIHCLPNALRIVTQHPGHTIGTTS